MGETEVVLLWLATTLDRFAIVQARAARQEMRVTRCAPKALRARDLKLGAGPVIAVLDDDYSAPGALGAGVDEVVRHSELTDALLDRAVVRASARAQARHRWLAQEAREDRSEALPSLLDWISIELAAHLSAAVLEAEGLEESVQGLATHDAKTLESIPRHAEMLEMTETVRHGLGKMTELLAAVRTLSGSEAPGTSVREVFVALSTVLTNRLVPIADLQVCADEGCTTSVASARLVAALVMLVDDVLARAARAGHAQSQRRVTLALRAYVVGDTTIVEVEDDAAASSSAAAQRRPSVADLRLWLREEGADLIVTTTPDRRTTRLVLPHPPVEPTTDDRSQRWQSSS